MGASVSSNYAKASANVTNQIQQRTDAQAVQSSTIDASQLYNNCGVYADTVDMSIVNRQASETQQMAQAYQDTAVQNEIGQSVAQSALASVEGYGLGFAMAANNTSEFTNTSTNIVNQMSEISGQDMNVVLNQTCQNSTIVAKTFRQSIGNETSQLSNQILNNTQQADLVNKIEQSITQKATAEVSGFSMTVFLWIMIIACSIFMLKVMRKSESNDSNYRNKLIGLMLTVVVLTVVVILIMGLFKLPPFFAKPRYCAIGAFETDCDTCGQILYKKQFSHVKTPMRYLYSILDSANNSSRGSLARMTIVNHSIHVSYNGGYNMNTYNAIQSLIDGIPAVVYERAGLDPVEDKLPNVLRYNSNTFEFIHHDFVSDPAVDSENWGSKTPQVQTEYLQGSLLEDHHHDDDDELTRAKKRLCYFNDSEWNTYLADSKKRQLFARYYLCQWAVPGFPLTTVMYENEELVSVVTGSNITEAHIASTRPNESLIWSTSSPYQNDDYTGALVNTEGTVTGFFKECHDKTWKRQRLMGIVMIVSFAVIIELGLIGFVLHRQKS